MKRIISFILVTVMILCLCACGSDGKDNITADMLIGKTFTAKGAEAYEDGIMIISDLYPGAKITFHREGKVDYNRDGELSWSIKDNKIQFTEEVSGASTYLYCDGYLVDERCKEVSKGTMPDGDTFNATLTVMNPYSDGELVIEFKTDGTCSIKTGDQVEEGYKYTRGWNLVSIIDEDMIDHNGEPVTVLYLYHAGKDTIYSNILFPVE